MSTRVPEVYIWEIARQARIAKWAWQRLIKMATHADDWPPAYPPFEMGDRFYSDAQAILTAAAQISKLLSADVDEDKWTRERVAFTRARAKAVREIVGTPSVLMTRAVRNALEHYDARLDDVLHASPDVGLQLGGVGGALPAPEASMRMRHIDYRTMTVHVLDVSVSLQDLMESVGSVGSKARDWIAANGNGWVE